MLEKLVAPAIELVGQCPSRRNCPEVPDEDWIRAGLIRSVESFRSGREFLQGLEQRFDQSIGRSHFFGSLGSGRRLALCGDVAVGLARRAARELPDALAGVEGLEGYDVYAGDGHYHKASCHERRKDGSKRPVGHFHSLDLRCHAMSRLALADASGERKGEHDMRALKRLDAAALRQGAPKGRKVIYVWDKAGVDFGQWSRWKQASGVYFVSLRKENVVTTLAAVNEFDRGSEVNRGVVSDYQQRTAGGFIVREVAYRCPASGAEFRFMTNVSNLQPGVIAHLYKMRWDIEKVFDVFKNRLDETKAWAKGDTAKAMQAHFLCAAHNLLLLLEHHIEKSEGISNLAEKRRRARRLDEVVAELAKRDARLPELQLRVVRITQRCSKFIRWIRNYLSDHRTSWSEALKSLERIYAHL